MRTEAKKRIGAYLLALGAITGLAAASEIGVSMYQKNASIGKTKQELSDVNSQIGRIDEQLSAIPANPDDRTEREAVDSRTLLNNKAELYGAEKSLFRKQVKIYDKTVHQLNQAAFFEAIALGETVTGAILTRRSLRRRTT